MQHQQSPVHSYKDEKFWYNKKKNKQTNKKWNILLSHILTVIKNPTDSSSHRVNYNPKIKCWHDIFYIIFIDKLHTHTQKS